MAVLEELTKHYYKINFSECYSNVSGVYLSLSIYPNQVRENRR